MSAGETAQDYLDQHITPEQKADVEAFLESLPEPEGTIQEVIARAQTEAMEAALADPEGHALVKAIHDRKVAS
ncbi:hypothetical protein [Arthrobacter sp. G119Y2]|uniref:hypothetical protein n=1 Tax=Arthrobacter sp. G119Y2 TaxID=3134965 RepID=UPI00311A4269